MRTPYPIVRKYDYQHLESVTFPNKRLYTLPNGRQVPSVTTILSTLPKLALEKWRIRIGVEEAARITAEACRIGGDMHSQLEGYVSGYLQGKPDVPPTNEEEKLAYTMAQRIRRFGLADSLEEVWGIEESLYVDGLYAGTADLLGMYLHKSSVIDYKSTRILKKEEWIIPYYMQISAYDLAHEEMTGVSMEQGVVIMAVRPPSQRPIQVFIMDQNMLIHYRKKWMELVEIYYS
jgi:CRISPR/Cas system-associated exonuclease Cas4 (RecB family)